MSKGVKFANFILISGIIVCIGLILYGLSKSDLHLIGSMNKYYIVSIIAMAVLIFVLFKCKDAVKVNIVILFFSAGISIYMVESLLMIYEYVVSSQTNKMWLHDRKLELLRKRGLTVDTRSKYELMMDLRAEGVDAFPPFNSSGRIDSNGVDFKGHKIFPLGSISNKPSIFCIEQGQYIIYDTDDHGFRNPQGLYNKDSVDIVLIGDSFAQGMCVQQEDDIAGWLRKRGYKVLNLGMMANGPLIEFATLREYAEPVQPKFVFWMWFEGNDPIDLEKEKNSTVLIKYLEGEFTQKLMEKQNIIDDAITAELESRIPGMKNKMKDNRGEQESNIPFSKFAKLSQIAKLSHLSQRLSVRPECSFDTDPLVKRIIESFKARVEGWNGDLYFIYLPAYERYQDKKNLCKLKYLNMQRDKLFALVKELKINIIDATELFDSHSDPLSLFPLRLTGHYTEDGYKLIAAEIDKRIQNE